LKHRTKSITPLGPGFYARPAETVARELLGARIISRIGGRTTTGMIVEAEAYVGPHDDASHAAARIGRTARNATMFGPPGIAYVYRSYGVHWCLNVVTDARDYPAAVLIRAIEPVDGLETMRERRGTHDDAGLGRGPGNLTRALGITGDLDGHPLDRSPLLIVQGTRIRREDVVAGPRIGITRATDLLLRFHVRSNRSVTRRS
jgi:DNA-3-methyladenine glycosylase